MNLDWCGETTTIVAVISQARRELALGGMCRCETEDDEPSMYCSKSDGENVEKKEVVVWRDVSCMALVGRLEKMHKVDDSFREII